MEHENAPKKEPESKPVHDEVAAGVLYAWGVVLTPTVGAGLMAVSTVVVAINARLLRLKS